MLKNTAGIIALAALAASICFAARSYAEPAPQKETIVLAGGCFWGIEAVFQHTKGVLDATSGYAGGKAETATYEQVSSGSTGHAEAVQVKYDPKQVSLDKLLDVYFNVAHNPTQLNFQGPDHGTQYRSTVFISSPEQKKVVEAKIAKLNQSKQFSDPIVTTLEPLEKFFDAESYHQNYAAENPYQPYIMLHDAPKVAALEKNFPELYTK